METCVSNKDKVTCDNSLSYAILILLFILVLLLCIPGANIKLRVEKRCTELTEAEIYDVSRTEFQYVPIRGGRIKTGYDVCITYGFEVSDGTQYITIYRTEYNKQKDYPDTIKVKYNPDNVSEFLFDNSEIEGYKEENWFYSKHLH